MCFFFCWWCGCCRRVVISPALQQCIRSVPLLFRFSVYVMICNRPVAAVCFFSLRWMYLMILTSFSLSSFSFGVCLFNKTAASKSAPKSKEENTFSISKHTLSISISNACLNLTCVYHYPWNTVVVAHRKEKPLHREKKQSQLNHYSFLDRFFLSDLLHNFVDTVEFKSLSTFSLLVLVDWFDCH